MSRNKELKNDIICALPPRQSALPMHTFFRQAQRNAKKTEAGLLMDLLVAMEL